MEIYRRQIWRVRRIWQHFTTMRLNGDMRTGAIVHPKNFMLPIRSFVNSRFTLSFQLLILKFCVDRLVPFRQFAMDNPFPIPPCAQQLETILKLKTLPSVNLTKRRELSCQPNTIHVHKCCNCLIRYHFPTTNNLRLLVLLRYFFIWPSGNTDYISVHKL